GYLSNFTISPDGNNVVFFGASSEANIRNYDLKSGRPLWKANHTKDNISSAVISPDGELIVTAVSNENTIEVHQVGTGKRLYSLEGNPGSGGHLTFSQDGTRIIAGNYNGTMAIWDTASGKLLASTIMSRSGEWATITPEGFFVASENGANLLHVTRGMETVGIDQVYDALYRPDLVKEALAGD
ncbi:MAG: PQQ-binding-like beta-propeller repeat protein, partial [Novosphingobium sp.]|nr:PQQ-binding-like beta-propeller repeat protein [Novosphingobium sp.]